MRDDRGDGGMAQGEGDLWRKGKRMEKEITRRWTTRFAWNLVSVLAKSYYALSFSPLAPFPLLLLSPLFHRSPSPSSLLVLSSSLYLSLSLSFPQRRVDACVQTQARKVLLSPILMHVQRRIPNLVSLSLSSLLTLASLLLSNLTPRKRAHNRVSVLFNVGGLLLTNTSLKSSSGSFHLPLFLLPPPPLSLPPLSSS